MSRIPAVLLTLAIAAGAAPKDDWAQTAAKRTQWWSLQPAKAVAPPVVGDLAWRKNAIDRFVFAKLGANGLQPAQPAELRVLMRRLAFVLTGLPPTPEQISRWEKLNDLAKVTDELLASPHFGERFARHWMDVARYADTYGYEWDNPAKGSWRYRDYLIRAFNADIGFDQLVREQIAGDLLPKPRINAKAQLNESVIGTMFMHLGEHRHGDSLEFNGIHQEMVNNKIDAFGKAFLGLTIACARCHDHKLDAISQRDYYALASVFMSARWTARVADAPGRYDKEIAELKKLRAGIRTELVALWRKRAANFKTELANAEKDSAWRKALAWDAKEKKSPTLESVAYPIHQLLVTDANATTLRSAWQKERAARLGANKAFTVLTDFKSSDLPAGWVMEGAGLQHGFVPDGTPLVSLSGTNAIDRLLARGYHTHALSSRLPGALRSPILSTLKTPHFSMRLAGDQWAGHITLVENAFQAEKVRFLKQAAPSWHRLGTYSGNKGWDVRVEFATSDLNPNFPPRTGLAAGLPHKDMGYGKRSWLSITGIATHQTGATPKDELEAFVSLYDTKPPASREEAIEWMAKWLADSVLAWADNRANAGDTAVVQWLMENGLLPRQTDASPRLATLVATYRKTEARIGNAAVVNSLDERAFAPVAYRLDVRGDVHQQGDPVPRDFLKIFSEKNGVANSKGSGRLELAEFLARPDNPLTARVYVNRVWHWLFGRGIVATPNDFGHLGEAPTHPELLDWLAREFVRNEWSTKWLVREIVSSRAFRQGGTVTAIAREKDPDNRLLHHYPTRRLEAEAIRDSLLAVSGRLDRKLFGRPIEPPRVREHPPKRLYNGPLDGDGRRSLYLRVTIMEPAAFLVGFNFPDPKLPVGARDTTNVPAQALMLLNDPFVNAQSEHWGKSLAAAKNQTVKERINRMFLRAFARKPSDAELKKWNKAFENFVSIDDAVNGSPKAWADLAHIMFNTKEFIYYR